MTRHGSSSRYSTLSKRVKIHSFRGPTLMTNRLSAAKQAERLQEARAKRNAEIHGVYLYRSRYQLFLLQMTT